MIKTGDPLPGPGGGTARGADAPALNDAGQIAWVGSDSNFRTGIWREDGAGNVSLVALGGTAAPGAGGDAFNDAFLGEQTVLNAAGQIAFRATLDNGDNGIWVQGPTGALDLVVRTGDAAPGTNGIFNSFSGGFSFNASGQLALQGLATGSGLFGFGLWVHDTGGTLLPIVTPGDPIEVRPGDTRIVSSATAFPRPAVTGNQDGRASSFSDSGFLAFRADFTNGTTGLFVASVNGGTGGSEPVPEPTTMPLLALGLLWLVFAHRARPRLTGVEAQF